MVPGQISLPFRVQQQFQAFLQSHKYLVRSCIASFKVRPTFVKHELIALWAPRETRDLEHVPFMNLATGRYQCRLGFVSLVNAFKGKCPDMSCGQLELFLFGALVVSYQSLNTQASRGLS